MRLPILLLVFCLGGVGVGLADAPAEQQIIPLGQGEQRVVPLDNGGQQGVQVVDAAGVQQITGETPKTDAEKVASTAGKIVLGVTSAAISIGFMVASLLFV